MIRRLLQQYILRRPGLPAAIAVAIALLAVATTGWAGQDVGQAARWPMVLASCGLAMVGLAVMEVRSAWFEMDLRKKVGRVVGVAMLALGFFGAMYALTEVPPGDESLQWVESYEEGRQIAEATNRPLMVDFTADWCVACQELEAEVFLDPHIRQRLETEFVAVKLDYDNADGDTQTAIHRFEVSGLPRVAFETPDGAFLRGASFEGKVGVDDFEERLDSVLAGDGYGDAEGWLEATLGERGIWALFLLVFGAGILSSLSPCIYPLIPITIGVFGARQAATRREGFFLSLSYVAGIVVTYSLLGLVAALLGTVFGGFLQNVWLLGFIALTFIILGLGCLGVYDFRLPGPLQKRFSEIGGVGHLGAFAMGLAAGVIAAPCIGPVVAGILVYVAQQGDILLGWSLLTVFAVGMGLLFLVLGTFSSLIHRLPRAGGWMEGIKAVFGAVFLGLGLYYLRLVTPRIGEWTDTIWLMVAL